MRSMRWGTLYHTATGYIPDGFSERASTQVPFHFWTLARVDQISQTRKLLGDILVTFFQECLLQGQSNEQNQV